MGGAGMRGQRAEEDRAVDGGRVALEVVERHVRIRRGRQLGGEPRQRGRQQLGVARSGRETFEVRRRRGRIGEAEALEPIRLVQTADSPFSPVRMRMDSSIGSTKTLPSPMEPVLAAPTMVEVTLSIR